MVVQHLKIDIVLVDGIVQHGIVDIVQHGIVWHGSPQPIGVICIAMAHSHAKVGEILIVVCGTARIGRSTQQMMLTDIAISGIAHSGMEHYVEIGLA